MWRVNPFDPGQQSGDTGSGGLGDPIEVDNDGGGIIDASQGLYWRFTCIDDFGGNYSINQIDNMPAGQEIVFEFVTPATLIFGNATWNLNFPVTTVFGSSLTISNPSERRMVKMSGHGPDAAANHFMTYNM